MAHRQSWLSWTLSIRGVDRLLSWGSNFLHRRSLTATGNCLRKASGIHGNRIALHLLFEMELETIRVVLVCKTLVTVNQVSLFYYPTRPSPYSRPPVAYQVYLEYLDSTAPMSNTLELTKDLWEPPVK